MILISKDDKEMKLYENDIVRVNRNKFKIIEENDWAKIIYNLLDD